MSTASARVCTMRVYASRDGGPSSHPLSICAGQRSVSSMVFGRVAYLAGAELLQGTSAPARAPRCVWNSRRGQIGRQRWRDGDARPRICTHTPAGHPNSGSAPECTSGSCGSHLPTMYTVCAHRPRRADELCSRIAILGPYPRTAVLVVPRGDIYRSYGARASLTQRCTHLHCEKIVYRGSYSTACLALPGIQLQASLVPGRTRDIQVAAQEWRLSSTCHLPDAGGSKRHLSPTALTLVRPVQEASGCPRT